MRAVDASASIPLRLVLPARASPKLILALQIESAGVLLGKAAPREAPGMGETREEGADWPPLNGDGPKEF